MSLLSTQPYPLSSILRPWPRAFPVSLEENSRAVDSHPRKFLIANVSILYGGNWRTGSTLDGFVRNAAPIVQSVQTSVIASAKLALRVRRIYGSCHLRSGAID